MPSAISGRRVSTDSAVSDPSQHVFHLARSEFRVDRVNRRNAAKRAVGALQPAGCGFPIAEALLRQGNDPRQPVQSIGLEAG